jgi:hypothetical protein
MSTAMKKVRQQSALGRLQKALEKSPESKTKRLAGEIENLESNIASGNTAKERRDRGIRKKVKVKVEGEAVTTQQSEEARLIKSMPFADARPKRAKGKKGRRDVEKSAGDRFWEQAPLDRG